MPRLAVVTVAAGLVVASGAAVVWHGVRNWMAAPPSRGTVVERPAAPRLEADAPPLLTEAALLAHRAVGPALLRLEVNPRVFVLDFPDLATQGAALNRVAALVEKAGLPRDRLLSDAELAAAIARAGDTSETYYYGHNYRADDLARFFALAARDGVPLNAAEEWVRAQLGRVRRLVPEGDAALISLAAPGGRVDAEMRAAILRHETGHGYYFTLPAYAAHVRRVWRDLFTQDERIAFRRFLAGEGYDPEDEELMMNEMQAYLIHTPDPRFFTPGHVGLTDAQVERLRTLLRSGAPLPP